MNFWVWGFGKCFGQKSYENENGGVGVFWEIGLE